MHGSSITITIPDIESMTDDELEQLARMRDGRWSAQTKALMRRFNTDKLNLNRAWAGTWQGWTCPCCQRAKPQIARLTTSGVLLCQLELHHDHLGDKAGKLFEEINQKSEDREFNIQVSHAKYGMLQFVERFERTLICIDCNLAEGSAKATLDSAVDWDFTFSPKEITGFIRATDNGVHTVDFEAARTTWERVKPDIADRLDFAERMAIRFAKGKNRREVAIGVRADFWIDDRALVWAQVTDALPHLDRGSIGMKVLARSVARDAVGKSAKRKVKPAGKPPSDAEFADVGSQNGEQKHWNAVSEDWTCGCCKRSKREICRKSNKGKWTARIHIIRDWIAEEDISNLYWRGGDMTGGMVIGSHVTVLICQDCRHIISEVQRRDGTLEESSLTLGEVEAAIVAIAPNQMHDVDYEWAIETARNNRDLVAAVDEYHRHARDALAKLARAKWLMKAVPCSFEKARCFMGYEHAKAEDVDLEEGDAYMDWLLGEGLRFESNAVG